MENFTNTSGIERFIKLYPVDKWKDVGFFTDDYIKIINPHWLQFDPPNKYSNYFLAILYICIFAVGGFGNFFVVLLYFSKKALRSPANMLIVNLAISDFFLLVKMPVFIFNSYYEGPALGDIGCRAYGLLGGLTGIASICTLAAIAMDRFYVIKYPLNRSFTNMRVKVCLVVVWIYALIFSVCPALNIGLNSYVPEGYLTSCSFDYLTDDNTGRIFILVFFVAAFCVPLGLIIFSYINILSVVMNRSVSVSGDSSRHSKEEDKRKQEMKLAMLCLSVVFLWFVSWTPYAIVALLGVSGNKQYINPITSMIPALFAKMASAVDPYVYALSHPKFKEEFYALFKKSNNNSNRVFSVSKPPKNINEEKSDDASEVESVELAG